MADSDVTFDLFRLFHHLPGFGYTLIDYRQVQAIQLSTTHKAVAKVILTFLGVYLLRCLLFNVIIYFLPTIPDQPGLAGNRREKSS